MPAKKRSEIHEPSTPVHQLHQHSVVGDNGGHSLLERVTGIEPVTQPWEGRVLPLNHTRQRLAVYVVAAVFASIAFIRPAQASEIPPISQHVTVERAALGTSITLEDGAQVGLFPGVLPGESDVSWSTTPEQLPALPKNITAIGSLYRLTITGVDTLNTAKKNIGVALPNTTTLWHHDIWMYDRAKQGWVKLDTKINATTKKLQAGYSALDAYLIVGENSTIEEGIGSWYCKKACSPRYPKLHGTSNDFPVGSYVTVTNQENGATVPVKIVSRWGQPAGRVVDLSWPAFAELKSSNAGLARVYVTPKGVAAPKSSSTGPVVATTTSTSETIPNLQVTALKKTSVPKVTASAYQVIDAGTGTVLASKNNTTARSIASLTKLMTAMVFLDTNPDMQKVVTYTKADVTPYAYLLVKPGETLTLNDLFYSMIVGSANNAATSLARSTGKTNAAFVAAMNAKANSWGLKNTHFADVSGLDPNNTSSAADMAIIANHAFHDYALIRKSSVALSYTFTTKNTKVKHTIKSTDKLLTQKNNLTITGGKTGYLDEALYTYVGRVKNSQGAQVIVTVLGSSSSATRFAESAALASWALANFTWK